MPWWGWIVLGTVILISEIIVSTDFYLVFFAASAVIVGLLVLLGASLPVSAQWLIFAALSIGMLVSSGLAFGRRSRRASRTWTS